MASRKVFLASGAAALGAGALPLPSAAVGDILTEADFKALVTRGTPRHRQAIGAARVNDGAALQYAVNTLYGFETGWGEGPGSATIALVLAGSAVTLAVDSPGWMQYRLRDIVKAYTNETLNADAGAGNPWAAATAGPGALRSLPALLARGVLIFACNTALGDVSRRIAAAGFASGSEAPAIQAALRAGVVSGVRVVPAGISALAVLQESGYTYFSAAV